MSRLNAAPYAQSYFTTDAASDFAEDFVLGERIGTAGDKRRGSSMWDALRVVALIAAALWLAHSLPASWKSWAMTELAAAFENVHSTAPPATEPQPPVVPAPIESARDVIAAPGADTGTAVVTTADAAPASPPASDDRLEDGAAATDEAALTEKNATPERLPAPVADAHDPLQKRALAAGLHPGISRAVLARLSPGDFRAAQTAIETAFAGKAALGDAIVWPKDAKGGRAQFEVRFVEAAAPECRRYVVTVIKDRWSTTAPAIENCNAGPVKRSSARQSQRTARN